MIRVTAEDFIEGQTLSVLQLRSLLSEAAILLGGARSVFSEPSLRGDWAQRRKDLLATIQIAEIQPDECSSSCTRGVCEWCPFSAWAKPVTEDELIHLRSIESAVRKELGRFFGVGDSEKPTDAASIMRRLRSVVNGTES